MLVTREIENIKTEKGYSSAAIKKELKNGAVVFYGRISKSAGYYFMITANGEIKKIHSTSMRTALCSIYGKHAWLNCEHCKQYDFRTVFSHKIDIKIQPKKISQGRASFILLGL